MGKFFEVKATKKFYETPSMKTEDFKEFDVILASNPDEDYDITKDDPGAGYWY